MATAKRTKARKSARVKSAPVRSAPVTERPPFPVYIRSADGELESSDREYIRQKLGRRLGKFERSIQRVSVRTEDLNGPRGGVDRVCRIKVVLTGLPTVIVENRNAAVRAAVDTALDGVERTVRRSLQRRRKKPLRKKG